MLMSTQEQWNVVLEGQPLLSGSSPPPTLHTHIRCRRFITLFFSRIMKWPFRSNNTKTVLLVSDHVSRGPFRSECFMYTVALSNSVRLAVLC